MRLFFLLFLFTPGITAADFAGPAACASCHSDIAHTQSTSHMAQTWLTNSAGQPASNSQVTVERATYSLKPLTLPIEYAVGGQRHGISFLARLTHLLDQPLARPTLIETRFMRTAHGPGLVLSPGFPESTPTGFETSLGRALAPDFEQKCLNCHGQPSAATGQGGIHCESCHGPSAAHARSQGKVHTPQADQLAQCETCHGGFAHLSDPIPEDLLISNQVNALKNSECFRNSDKLNCTTCHDPHSDNTNVVAKSVAACKTCHAATTAPHAALCPVNKTDSCTTCHMPQVKRGPFTLIDHWIRADRKTQQPNPDLRSTLTPKRLYLRLIVTAGQSKAAQALQALQSGQPFFEAARTFSIDNSAAGGGFLGDTQLDTLSPALAKAAAALNQGEISPIIPNGTKFLIVQRIPTNFREQANNIVEQATRLRLERHPKEAAAKYQEALAIYPYFLRGLVFLAGTLGEQGDNQRAAAILQFASQLYPQDPAPPYNLGVTMGQMGNLNEEAAAYRRAISLEPSLIGAYQNLGASLLAQNKLTEAEQTFRAGLRQDPLSAALNFNLGIVLEQQNRHTESKSALDLAKLLDPQFVQSHSGTAQ